jgi:hypothetical protein
MSGGPGELLEEFYDDGGCVRGKRVAALRINDDRFRPGVFKRQFGRALHFSPAPMEGEDQRRELRLRRLRHRDQCFARNAINRPLPDGQHRRSAESGHAHDEGEK